MNELIQKILADTKATEYQLYLTASEDKTAFRKQVYPEYKANRKSPKPVHYLALREFLTEEYETEVISEIEADDAIGIAQDKFGSTIICSIDKDLDMIPGLHYNFVKEIMYSVTDYQGIYNFYTQCLTGDTADNVKGVSGIGKKKAESILYEATTEQEMFDRVRKAYDNDQEFLINGEVLWIMRLPMQRWSLTTFGSQLLSEGERRPE